MTCHDARERLSELVDDALEVDARAEVETHVAGCPECRAELGRLRATVAALRGLERPRAPVGFVDRVMEQVGPIPWYRRLGAWLFLPLAVKLPAGAAAVAVVAGLTLLVWERSPELRTAARHELASGPSLTQVTPAPRDSSPVPRTEVTRPERSAPAVARSKQALSSPAQGSGARVIPPRARETVSAAEAPPARQPTPAPPARASAVAPSSASTGAVSPAAEADSGPRRTTESKVAATAAPPADAKAELQVRQAPAPRPLVAPGSSAATVDRGEPRARANAESARRILGPAASPDAAGRLVVRDRDVAAAGVTELLSRLGGREIARRRDDDDTVLDVQLPAARYDEFVRGLDTLGTWTPGAPPSALSQDPPQVRLTIRLGG